MTTSPTTQTIDFEQATSNRRLVARLIDFVLGWFILLTVGGCIAALIMTPASNQGTSAFTWIFLSIWLLLLIAYDTIMHHSFGKTLGKMLLGLRVVDAKGDKLNWGMCLLRAILLYILIIAVIFLTVITASLFGWIIIGSLNRYKRFPHDNATHSFVVRELKGELVKPTEQSAKPTPFADLERLRTQGMISEEEFERKKRETEK